MKGMEIEKTNRMNALFEFYAALLTDKQMNYIELYYADDYSLAEIAEEFGVSRQAVYDNIKRTEKILEDYEMKLHMYSDYIVRSQIFDQILERYPEDTFLQEQVEILSSIDQSGSDYGQSRHLSRNTLQTISSRGSISYSTTDYLAQWYLQSYANRF